MSKNQKNSITSKVAVSGAWIYGRLVVTSIINLGVIAILARQLTPGEFGIVALAGVILQLLTVLGAQGVNQFVIYDNDEGREDRVHAAFWLDLTIAILSLVIGIAAIPLITKVYTDEGLGLIILVMLIKFPMDALSRIPDALLKKNLDFKQLEIRDTFLQVFAGLTSVGMALTGFGVWSLIIPSLIASPLRAIIIFKISKWRPQLKLHLKEWKRIFSYSMNIIGSTLTTFIISQGDTLLVGKLMGTNLLGIYNLSWRSSNLITRTIIQVSSKLALPTLAKVSDDIEKLRNALSRILKLISTISFPLLIGLFVVADDFILTLYGSQWEQAILPLRIMIIYALRFTVTTPIGAVFKSIGRPDINFKIGLLIVPFYLIGIYIGSFYGIIGVASGVTIVRTSFGLISFWLAGRFLKSSFYEIIKPLFPAFAASSIMGFILYFTNIGINSIFELNNYINLILLAVIGGGIYLFLLRTYYNPLAIELSHVLNPLLGKRSVYFARLLNIK